MWLDIKDFKEYQINEKGTVRRISKNGFFHYVKPGITSNGKYTITLWKNGKRSMRMLHNILIETFHFTPKEADRILYQGYSGDRNAMENIRKWILQKIHECEQKGRVQGENYEEEIRYLEHFLDML